MAELMFMMRVKLPPEDPPAASPGDIVYGPWKKAIFSEKPPGFEIQWPREGQCWPVDSDGYTFVPLYITNRQEAHLYYINSHRELQRKYDRLAGAIKELPV